MTTRESNKLLAEFMGVFDKILSTQNIHSWSDAPFYYTTENSKEKVIENISNYVKYDTDWNWLMEVVEKIEDLGNDVSITTNYIQIAFDEGEQFIVAEDTKIKIDTLYNACVEFVQWYNKNK